jgi:hypothetical protein
MGMGMAMGRGFRTNASSGLPQIWDGDSGSWTTALIFELRGLLLLLVPPRPALKATDSARVHVWSRCQIVRSNQILWPDFLGISRSPGKCSSSRTPGVRLGEPRALADMDRILQI